MWGWRWSLVGPGKSRWDHVILCMLSFESLNHVDVDVDPIIILRIFSTIIYVYLINMFCKCVTNACFKPDPRHPKTRIVGLATLEPQDFLAKLPIMHAGPKPCKETLANGTEGPLSISHSCTCRQREPWCLPQVTLPWDKSMIHKQIQPRTSTVNVELTGCLQKENEIDVQCHLGVAQSD